MALIAAYGFGAGSGSTIADDSGNGHTLTIGSASFTASGHTGAGLTNTAANSTGASTSSMTVVTGTACTLMAWVKPLDLTSGSTHFICGAIETSGNTDFALFTQRGAFGTPDVLQGNVRVGGLVAVNGAAMTLNTWAHVALTFDGASLRLYKDGSLVATVANAGSLNNSATFYIAGANPTAALDTDVVVDDVRYYSDVLDGTAITAAMNTPVGTSSLTLTDAPIPARLSSTPTTSTMDIVLRDVVTPSRLVSAAATAALGLTIPDTPKPSRLAGTTDSITLGLALKDSPGLVRAATIFGETVGSTTVFVDPAAGAARLSGTPESFVSALVLADDVAPMRLGSTADGVTILTSVEFFVCQDFAGSAHVGSYGGATSMLAYDGSTIVESLGGSVHIDSYGGTAANCGR